MKERRKFRRAGTIIRVICKVMGVKGENTLKTLNISGGGMRLYLREKVEKGVQLELGLMVPPSEHVFFALARVAWQSSSRTAYGYETGIEFLRMDISEKMKLMRYVRELLKKGTS